MRKIWGQTLQFCHMDKSSVGSDPMHVYDVDGQYFAVGFERAAGALQRERTATTGSGVIWIPASDTRLCC